MTATVLPYLQQKFRGEVFVTRNLSFTGIGESSLEELVKDIIQSQTNPTVAPYASQGVVRIRITARAATPEEGEALIDPVATMIAERTQPYLFSTTGQVLEEVIGERLTSGLDVSIGESCTGGLVGHRITNVPGSSRYFLRGYVVYSNEAKAADLGVKQATLAQYGAVSRETAAEMAEGAAQRQERILG